MLHFSSLILHAEGLKSTENIFPMCTVDFSSFPGFSSSVGIMILNTFSLHACNWSILLTIHAV